MDLSTFTPEQLAQLKTAIEGLTDTSGRSPLRPRQLHDLRLVPTKDDPRPTFFWTAESPRNAADLTKTTPYPRLMWHGVTGQEIAVTSEAIEQSKTAEGFILTPPANAEAPDPAEMLRVALEQLSPEDRKTVLEAAHKSKLEQVQALAAGLSTEDLAKLAASLEPVKTKRSA